MYLRRENPTIQIINPINLDLISFRTNAIRDQKNRGRIFLRQYEIRSYNIWGIGSAYAMNK